ncbi:MAG TPA: sigma-70 family RNA polymerase sigma factor [Rubricoccaceae bacterium]|jgi:RNA polymerase sigma factor (sigma-70 family)|nr:sigma-70 family RNA polymerase sigma factor [Rubricoccaceae bacterium]
MLFQDRLDRLGAVAAHLPFPQEDFDAVNRTFCRWAERREDRDHKALEVWLYCYVQRYVLSRLLRLPRLGGGEADRIIGEVFERAHEFDKVTEPERFTHWVSVVCRNTFINGLRRRYQPADVDVGTLGEAAGSAESDLTEPDRALLRHAVTRAFEALPEALQPVARMRLLEGRSYRHIAAATGHPLPTVRTYAAKAVRRLREDPGLRALGQALNLVPP